MTAAGKLVTARLKPGDRILVQPDRLAPAVRKTRQRVATVVYVRRSADTARRYVIGTDLGAVEAAPSQTFWAAKPAVRK